MTILRAACYSDIGKVRKENEDRVIFDEDLQLFGVADGVGGLPGGGEAAQETADRVTQGIRAAPEEGEIDLRTIVTQANDAVVALGMRLSPDWGSARRSRWGASVAGASSWRMSVTRVPSR